MNIEIVNRVKELIVQYINPNMKVEEIQMDEDMIGYGMNSLSFIRLIVALEDEFDIEFDEMADSSAFRTVTNITKYVESNIE